MLVSTKPSLNHRVSMHTTEFVAFARGMAMFGKRRVSKKVQEDLLRKYLPEAVRFLGAFDKSGNYAIASSAPPTQVGAAILKALRNHDQLHDLEEVAVAEAAEVCCALAMLREKLLREYAQAFDPDTFGVKINGEVWRAGLSFLPKPVGLGHFSAVEGQGLRVKVLGTAGSMVMFLKREETSGENRISFGVPTKIIGAAVENSEGHPMASTSRSARTIRGVLRCLERRRMLSNNPRRLGKQ